jgi:putative aldouronate transport system permease protein
MFITMLFGGGLVPWYMVCTQLLHLKDTIFALFVPSMFSSFSVVIMRTFYQTTIPDEIVEAARIDGASDFRTYATIVMPLSLPGLATIGLFACIGYWNDWWLPMLFITNEKLIPLQSLIQKIMGNLQYLMQYAKQVAGLTEAVSRLPMQGARMAVVIVTIGPVVLFYPFFQRYFVKGLTIGAIKG